MSSSVVVRDLPFRKIPHQPGIFLRYLDLSPDALSFYRHPPSLEGLVKAAGEVRQGTWRRREVAEILRSQNEAFGSDGPVRQYIEDLEKPDCVAVLTGQQAGLFGGPILTVYKALTALRLSEELRRRGSTAVPIFWMASDDHDLAEITRLAMSGPDQETRELDARELLFGTTEMPPYPVGTIRLPETIERALDAYAASFAGYEGSSVSKTQLASAYRQGTTFAEAFGRLMAELFRGRGLILFDPRSPDAKRIAAPVVRKALAGAQALRAQLGEQRRKLQSAGLEPQVAVLPRSTLVFLEDRGERRLLVTENGAFALKETGRHYTLEELSDLTERTPERFSPNVLLRPLVQDYLFPTAAYVGGPAEVSYFAQVEPLYRFFDRPMPVIWPRSSFTVLAPEICTSMERHDLHIEDCFQGGPYLARKILQKQPADFEVLLSDLRRHAERGIEEMKPALAAADPSLGAASDTVRRKLLHRVGSLQSKCVSFEMRRNSHLRQEVLSLLNSCYPNGNLQERELGVHSLLARVGPSLLDTMYALTDVTALAHRIVCL